MAVKEKIISDPTEINSYYPSPCLATLAVHLAPGGSSSLTPPMWRKVSWRYSSPPRSLKRTFQSIEWARVTGTVYNALFINHPSAIKFILIFHPRSLDA